MLFRSLMIVTVLLAGCASGGEKEFSLSPEELGQTIFEKAEFTDQLTLLPKESLYRLYDLDSSLVEDSCLYSVVSLVLSALLVLFSSRMLSPMQAFFESFFHRSVNLSKWTETILALMAFPMFAVVVFDAIIFYKFSDLSKTILILTAFALTAFFIAYMGCTRGQYYMDNDTASDVLLANECWLAKTFFPRTWHYSTEFRILQAERSEEHTSELQSR